MSRPVKSLLATPETPIPPVRTDEEDEDSRQIGPGGRPAARRSRARKAGRMTRAVGRQAAAVIGVSLLSLLFIGSYVGALHKPVPHQLSIAVKGPVELGARLDASPALKVKSVPSVAEATRAIDRRQVYGAVLAGRRGSELVTAPAAGLAAADVLEVSIPRALKATGTPVRSRVVHPLPAADARGLVGFYTVVGLILAGYLGATFLGILFGTRLGSWHTRWRLVAVGMLSVLVGLGGAALARSIGDLGGAFLALAPIAALTTVTAAAVTVALQSAVGIFGTGIAVLLFVVLGNPSSGGPYSNELLPGLWRAVGPLLPNGAATTAVRDVAYFPDASLAHPLLVLGIWLAAGLVVALALGHRRGRLTGLESGPGQV